MDKEYIKFLYENYNKKHNFANSLGDFETDLKDKEYRKFLFDEYNPKANFAKSYDEFETDLGLKKKDLPNQDVSKPYVFGGEKPKLGYTASEVLEKSSTSKSPSTSELGNQPTPKDEIKIDFKPVVGGAFNANAAAENEDAARQERIDLGRQKLRFLTSDNKVKQDRIASIGALKQLNAEAQPILDQITEIQSHAVDNQLPPELYGHYQELQNQLEPYKQQIDALSNNISKSYDVSNTLLAGIRSVDAKYQNVLSKQFTLGKKASSAILQTRDNLVKSAGRIVETVGDIAAAQQEYALGINAPHDDKKWTDEMGKSIDEYANNLSKITDQTLPQSYKTYSPVGDKFDLDKFLYFGMNSTAQLAPTIGAALATGGAGAAMTGFTMEFGGMYDTFHEPIKKKYLDQGYSEAEAENKADIEAGIISTAGSAIIGQLDRFGSGKLIDSFGKKALMKRYATVAAENIGEKLGKEYAVEVTKKTLKKVIGEFASGFIKATAPEAGTEFAQELVAPAGQDIYDLATGGDTFKGVQLANKQTWENAANAGIGAFVASGIGGIGAGYKNIANPTNYEIAMNVKDEDDFQMFSNAIKNEINAGFITEEMAQSAIDNVKRIQEADKLLPKSVDNPMARSQAVALLLERQDIEAEVEGKDKNLVEPQDNRIKEINNLLKSISNGNIVPDNIQDDGSIRNTIRNKNKVEPTNTGGEGVPTLTTGTEQTPTDGTGVQKPTAPNIKQEGLGEGETAQTKVTTAKQLAKKLEPSKSVLIKTVHGDKAFNYINKDGIEVTLKNDEEGGYVNGNQVQADVHLDFIGNDKKRGEGLASKELDRIIKEADKNNMSISLVVDSEQAVRGTESKKGLSNKELKKWYESKGFIFDKNSRFGYRPKTTEDVSIYKKPKYIAKEGEVTNDNIEYYSSPDDLQEAFDQDKLKEGTFYEDGDGFIYKLEDGKLKEVENVKYVPFENNKQVDKIVYLKSKPEAVETTPKLSEEEKAKDNKAAEADGWKNAPYAINSINSWVDGTYKSFKEIPTYIKKFVAGVRSLIDQHTDPSDAIKASRKYLDQAVSDGEITQEQADEISNKVSNNFTKKREAKNKLGEAIAETTKLGKSNLKQTMVNGLTLIKEKFKSRIKGEKIGEKNTKTFYKDLRDKFIEQYRQDKKGGNINLKEKNERRLISLINGIKNEKTLEKALDYLKDVSKSNDFADKKDEARALRKKIVPKKAGNKINEVKTFKDINPSDINDETELDKYIESAKALINGKTADLDIKFDKKQNKIDEAFDHAKNWQNLQDGLDALENTEIVDSKTLRTVARQYAKAKKAIDMLRETGIINEEDYIDALARVNEAIDKIDEDFQQYKQETIDNIKDQKTSLSINDVIKSLNNPEWASKVKEFFAINDYEDMGIVDLENMSSILDNLADGQVNEEFVNFIKDQNIRKGAEEFAPTLEQAISAEEEFRSGWQKFKDIFYSPIGKFKTTEDIKNKMRELSPSELDRFMGTLVNGVGSFFNNVYSKFIIPAEVEYSKAVDKALTQLKNITHKLTPVENKMVGLILIQRQHIANLTEEKIAPLLKDWEKKFEIKNDRKPTPEESAEAVKGFNDYFKTINDTFPEKRANTDATEKENKEDREAYDNLRSMGIIREDGSVATDEEIAQKTGNLDSDSKKAKVLKAVKEVRQILDGLKDKNEINTISLGKELENIEEYYPLFTRNLNETKGNKSLEEQAKRSITGTVHSALGLESGSTEKRRNTLNDVSLDLNDNVAKAIRDVNKQFYYLNALQTTLGILNRAAAKKSIKYSANRKSVMNALIQSTRGYVENKFLAQASSSVFGKMVSNLKLSILARLSKPLVEYTANLIKAITLDASFIKSIAVFGEDEKARENLISHLSLLSLKTTKHTSETTSIEDSWLKRQMSNIVRFADNAIALNYWYHKFGKEFKKQTGKDFDAKKYNTDEEYRNYVHNQTINFLGTIEKDVEFVVGNQSAITQPQVRPSIPFSNFFRHKRWYEKSFGINSSFYRFFNPFTSFVAKERRTLLDGVGDLRRGDYRLGTAKIASVYASNAVYTYGMAISGNLTASAIAYLIGSAMDDDDKYKALMEQIRKNRLNAAEDLFTKESFALQSIGAMFGASLAQYGYLVRPVLAFMIGEYLKTADKDMAVKLQKIVKQSNTVYPNVYSKEPILDYGLQLAGVASGMEQSISALYEAYKGLSDKTKAQEELSNYIGLGAATYGISQMFFPLPSSTDFLNVARDAQRLTSFKAATSGLKKLADEWYIAKENNDAVRMALIDKRADSFINDFLTKSYKGIKSSDFHNLYSTMQKVRNNYKTYEAFVNEVEPELIKEKNETYSKIFNFMLKK
jgi:hypothetical protein